MIFVKKVGERLGPVGIVWMTLFSLYAASITSDDVLSFFVALALCVCAVFIGGFIGLSLAGRRR